MLVIKKRGLVFISLVCLCLFAGCKGKEQERNEKIEDNNAIVLRYAESEPQDSVYAQISDYFAALVKEKSHGTINIKVYYDGYLGKEEEVLTQLQFGGIAMGRVSLLSLTDEVPSLQVDFESLITCNFPNALEYIKNNKKKVQFSLQGEKMSYLTILPPSMRCIYSDNSFEFDDLNTYKLGIDSGSIYEKYLTEKGYNPVIVGNADTYLSLRNGFIDLRESSLASLVSSNEYPYINQVVLLEGLSIPSFIVLSNEVMNQLSQEENALITSCAEDTMAFALRLLYPSDSSSIDTITRDHKMRVFNAEN